MKKFIISTLVLLITFCTFLPSVLAEESGYIYTIDSVSTSLTSSGQKLTAKVTNLSDQQTDDLLIAAAYSYENELLDFYYLPLSLDPFDTDTFRLSITADSTDISYIKVFIWDSFESLTPLADEWAATPSKPLDFAVLLSVKNSNIKLLCDNGSSETFPASESALSTAQSILDSGATAKDRIVTYNMDSVTGELVSITKASENSAVNTIDISLATYKTRTSRLGTHTIADNTIILDATLAENGLDKPRNYTVTDKTGLVDGEEYTGYVFKQDGCTSLVLITKIHVDFDEAARFVVIQDEACDHYTDDYEKCELVVALANGVSEQKMLFKTGVYEEYDLGIGDAIFYTMDSTGFVNEVYKIYDYSEGTFTQLPDIVAPMFEKNGWSYSLISGIESIQLTTGAVIEVNNDYIVFASLDQVKTGTLDTNIELEDTYEDGIVAYPIASDAVAYVYDINSDDYDEADKFRARSVSSVKASNLSAFETEEDGVYENIDMSKVNEALVMIVDGDIVEIYVIEK